MRRGLRIQSLVFVCVRESALLGKETPPCAMYTRSRKVVVVVEEEEEEEGLFKADAVNEEDPERDRTNQV